MTNKENKIEEVIERFRSQYTCEGIGGFKPLMKITPSIIEGFIHQNISQAIQQAKEERDEEIMGNLGEFFRGKRIKMSLEEREVLLQAIDLTNK